MVKVKLFSHYTTDGLERSINNFLANHRTSDIIDIQYKVTPHVSDIYSVCITYRDGS